MSFAGDTDRFLHQENVQYIPLIHRMKSPALATQPTDSSSHNAPLQLCHSFPIPLPAFELLQNAHNSCQLLPCTQL